MRLFCMSTEGWPLRSLLFMETTELSCLSGTFAYHKLVGPAQINSPTWLYKIKYVTVTTWKQETWLSLLPYGYLSLVTLFNEPLGFDCPVAQH